MSLRGNLCPSTFYLEETVIIKEVEINEKICDAEIRVIDENGVQLGIMSAREANKIADEKPGFGKNQPQYESAGMQNNGLR